MRRVVLLPAALACVLLAGCGGEEPAIDAMRIASPAFADGEAIPKEFTCDGRDVSPPLSFDGIPEKTRRLALIVDDPDARGWVHWIAWNIDPEVGRFEPGTVPEGVVEGRNGFGKPGYGGPCPPSGTHAYRFRLFALDRPLTIPPSSNAAAVAQAMTGHVLGQATLTGTYGRER